MVQPIGQSPFQQIPIAERLPAELTPSKQLEANSVVERRENSVRYFPTSSQDYIIGAGATQRVVSIPMSSSGYLDPQTAVLSSEVLVSGTSASAGDLGVIENGGLLPLIEEATLFIGGQMVERVRQPGVVYNALALATETQGHHDHAGTFKGEWVYGKYSEGQDNAEFTGAATNCLTQKITNKATAAKLYSEYGSSTEAFTGANGSGASTANDKAYRGSANGNLVYYTPLASLFGFFRLAKYQPLRNMGNIVVQLRLHSDLRTCLVNLQTGALASQALPADTKIELKNMVLSTDIVYPAAALVSSMDTMLQSDATGIIQKIDTYSTQDQNFTGQTEVNEKSINFQIGSRYLKAVYFVFRSQNDLVSPCNFSQSAFPSMGYRRHRLFINGVSVPEGQPTDNPTECFVETNKALNMLGDVDASGLIPFAHYVSDVSRTGAAGNTEDVAYVGRFVCGVNLDQMLQSGMALQGINTLAGQSVIRLELSNRGTRNPLGREYTSNQCIATGIFSHSTILQVRMSAVEVSSQ